MRTGSVDPYDQGRKTVLIYESVVVDRPFSDLATWLPIDDSARDGLTEAATEAFARGAVGRGRLSLGSCRERSESIVLPLLWETAVATEPIETFEGDLQVAPFGDSRCHLSISLSHRSARSDATSDRRSALADAEARVRVFLNLLAGYYFTAHPRA